MTYDYTLNVAQIYSAAIYYHITGTGDLATLQDIPMDTIPKLPSWVTKSSSGYFHETERARIGCSRLFRAKSGILHDVRIEEIIILTVLVLAETDKVIAVADTTDGKRQETTNQRSFLKTLLC